MNNKAMEQVFVADNPTQARMIAGFLQSHDIPTEVRGELLWSVAVEFIFSKGAAPSVWVPAGYAQRARELIQEQSQAESQAAWRCNHCGEENDGQFTHCWQCGAPSVSPADDSQSA